MIAKINNGNSFKGVLNYVLGEGKGYEILSASGVLETSNVNVLTQQFVVQAVQSKRVEKPVWHAQISFAKEDESLIDDEKIREIGEEYLKKMGITGNQYLIVKHTDTTHQHIHLVINRVTGEGRALEDNMMKKRSMQAAQELELEHGLTVARLKGKNYSAKDADSEYVYGFKPNKQILNNKVRAVFREASTRQFSTFREMDTFLLGNGIKIYENVSQRNGKSFNYTSLDYTYKYLDNSSQKESTATNTIKTSRIGKGYGMQYLIGELKLNNMHREEKIKKLSEKIEKSFKGKVGSFTNKGYLFRYLHAHDIDMRLSYFKESLQETGLPKKLKGNIMELYEERQRYRIPQAELKKQLFNEGSKEIAFSEKMTFSFSKADREILGNGKLEDFYRKYIGALGKNEGLSEKVPEVVKRVLANKLADNNTVNYVVSSITGIKLPYHHQAVNADLARICFNLSHKGELAKTDVHKKITESRTVIDAYSNFREFSDSPKELLQYLAKRGVEVKMKEGNAHLFSDGFDLGMASKFGIKEFVLDLGVKGGKPTGFSEKEARQIFIDMQNPDKLYFYRLLDKKNIKDMSIIMKGGKSFKIDDFDLKFIHDEFKEIFSKKFERDSHRGKISKNNPK